MTNCKNCGKEFEPKRATAKFCSDACKMKFARRFAQEMPGAKPGIKLVTVKAASNKGNDFGEAEMPAGMIKIDMQEWYGLKEYCEKHKITIADLITGYESHLASEKIIKSVKTESASVRKDGRVGVFVRELKRSGKTLSEQLEERAKILEQRGPINKVK